MALDLGRSALGLFGVVALFMAPSCVVEEKGDDDDDDSGCEVDFDCNTGQICENDRCIADPGTGGSSSGTAGSSSTAGSSGKGGSGGSTGSAGSAGSTGVSGSTGSGGSGGSSAVCSEDDPITCPSADEMTLCIEGAYETWTCEEGCVDFGFELGACAEPNGCDCGDPLDEECSLGVSALCSCDTCTDEDAIVLYIACYQNDPPEIAAALRCLTEYVDIEAQTVDCDAGLTACDPGAEPAP
jgi:hypothetical protein